MSCEQRPSVTLWGTTQVTTRTTVLSTITRADARRTTSSVTATQCDGDGNCGPVARPTVIVDEADLSFETITTETVLTNVVPVQTRYHECPPDPSLTVEPGTTGEALSAIISQTEISNDSLTVTNAVPAPTSSPSPAPDQSSPPSSSSTATETARSRQTTRSSPSDDETSREPTMSVDFSSFEATRTDDDLSAHTSTLPNGRTSPVTTGTNDSAAGTGSSGLATHSGLSPSEIAGVSIGSVFGAILVLILLLRYRRKRQTRRDNDDDDDPEETYWERRFQEREGGTEKLTDGPATGDSPRDEEGTHHKHVSLYA